MRLGAVEPSAQGLAPVRRHCVEPLVGTGVLGDVALRGEAPPHQAPQLGVDLALCRLEEEVGDAAFDELAEVIAGHLPPREESQDGIRRRRKILLVGHLVRLLSSKQTISGPSSEGKSYVDS